MGYLTAKGMSRRSYGIILTRTAFSIVLRTHFDGVAAKFRPSHVTPHKKWDNSAV